MRRVRSYGGSDGAPASVRLKYKLSSTHGLQLLSNNSVEETGFLALSEEPVVGRIIHRTSQATRNFYSTASALQKSGKREFWTTRKDPLVSVVEQRTIFDDPVVNENYFYDGMSSYQTSDQYHGEGLAGNLISNHRINNNHRERVVDPVAGDVAKTPEITLLSSPCDTVHLRDIDGTASNASGSLPTRKIALSIDSSPDDEVSSSSRVPEQRFDLEKPVFGGELPEHAQHFEISPIGGADVAIPCGSPDHQTTMFKSDTVDNVEVESINNPDIVDNSDCHPNPSEAIVAAAVTIQRCSRRWLVMRRFEHIKSSVVMLQSLVRRNQQFKLYKTCLKAAIVMQKNWRAVQSVRLVKQLRSEQEVREQQKIEIAAVVLQKHWRGVQSRHVLKHLKMEQSVRAVQRVNNAAVVLQKHWRAAQSRCLVTDLKVAIKAQLDMDNAAVVVQRYWRALQSLRLRRNLKIEQATEAARLQQRMDEAAAVVQKHWRAFQSNRLMNLLKMEEALLVQQRMDDASVVVQKHWRAWQSKRFVETLKMDKVVRAEQKINKAIVLQKHWRAVKSRCLVTNLKVERAVRAQQRMDNAAVVVQKFWRALQCKRLSRNLKLQQTARLRQGMEDAAIVLQKYWRGLQSRSLAQRLKINLATMELHRADNAAILLQKHWRGLQSRSLAKNLKMDVSVREDQRAEIAAIVVQKYWRGLQSRWLAKQLRMELVGIKHQRADDAAIVLQKHWRGLQSRLIAKYLKMELAAKEDQRAENAAIVVQKYWRALQSRWLAKRLKMELAVIERMSVEYAAIVLQKHWRGFQSRMSAKKLKMELAVREHQRAENAAIILQKYWRAQHSKLLVAGLVREQQRGAVAVTLLQTHCSESSDILSCSESNLQTSARTASLSREGVELHPDLCVECVDRTDDSMDSLDGRLYGCQIPTSQLEDPSQGLDNEVCATQLADLHVQKNGDQEDWNNVPVDQLEECLDTYLSVLRPLSSSLSTSTSSQLYPSKLGVPCASDSVFPADNIMHSKSFSNKAISPLNLESSTHYKKEQEEMALLDYNQRNEQFFDSGASHVYEVKESSLPSYDHPLLHEVLLSSTVNEFTSPLQEASSKSESSIQGTSRRSQTLKQNEQQLQQFAQIFLLQRQIALQQQRAQAAPPFPPRKLSQSEISGHVDFRSLEFGKKDFTSIDGKEEAPVQIIHTNGRANVVRQDLIDVIRDIKNHEDDPIIKEQPAGSQDCKDSTDKVVNRPGADVVLDMVLLLRRIEQKHECSLVDVGDNSSSWIQSGDIEEGTSLLNRNLGSVRTQNSVVNFANAVGVRHFSIPDVNAVLLVLIAVMVYTRTFCRGVFLGSRQTDRRI